MRRALACQIVGGMAFFAACILADVASAQTRTIRVVTYNIQADVSYGTTPLAGLITPFSGTGTFTTSSSGTVTDGGVLEGIGEEVLAGNSQPIDILALQETTSNGTTVQPIVDGLNAFYSLHGPVAGYAMSPYQATQAGGNSNGNGPNALVYNTNTLQLVASVGIVTPTGSGNGVYRQVVRYLFAPAGVATNANNIFYVYVSHYKAGTNSTDLIARTGESGIIRTNSASLPSDARVLYVGDYNVSTSAEASYQNIVSKTLIGIRGIDPFNVSGFGGTDWTTSSALNWKTESCRSLHYRDDFQMLSSNVYYGVAGGLAYVSGTYHTFGNNGSTPYLSSIIQQNTSLNSSLQSNPPISAAQCYTNLYGASDHLPVVADYTIPVPASLPVALFTVSPTEGTVPLTANFTDNSTGMITGCFWSFGDGGTTNFTAPTNVTYTYNTAGVYTVTLVATGPGGSSTNTQVNLIHALSANFSANVTTGPAPLQVVFTDTSVGGPTNWAWDFDNNGTTDSTGQNPTNTYAAGTYTTKLIVSYGAGSSTNAMTILAQIPIQSWSSYYGVPADSSDADGDGVSNTNEFLTGFNPTNSSARLKITNIVNTDNTNVTVTYLGASGDSTYTGGPSSRTNVLESTLGTPPSYTNTFLPVGAGGTNILNGGTGLGQTATFVHTNGASGPAQYYRVRVLVP
jgi:PKD repeat protein